MKLKDRLLNRLKYLLKYNPRKSLNKLDDVIEKHLDINNGVFIEVGANNGISQSNTYYLEVVKGWRGLLIEPIERLYKECVWNRPRAMVVQRALVGFDFKGTNVTIHDSSLMSVIQHGDSLTPAQERHLERGRKLQNLSKSPFSQVPAQPLSSLLDGIDGMEKVDLFSLDVEGFELQVLKGIDFSRHRPSYILVETSLFSDVRALLEENNYTFLEKCTHHDYLFKG
ncbi:FkbM family methyltransferase [Rubritalea spongiae]|uniref:FkbM family methyltransferase n=1 Tax=Rubritalea spongiae TaxID=430797 RepID=A0ABW5E1B5_9BACT